MFDFQISENDHLPQSICFVCWKKLDTFHKFYEAVNEAKYNYLMNFVKMEEMNFIEMSSAPVECNGNELSIKLEPIPDNEDAGTGAQPLEDHTAENVPVPEVTKSNFENNIVDDPSVAPPHLNGQTAGETLPNKSKSLQSDGGRVTKEIDSTAPNMTNEVAKEKERNSGTNSRNHELAMTSTEFDHLISNYMDMKCEVCNRPFGTLMEAHHHYQRKHKQKTALLKCCQRRLQLPHGIRDHIQFHLDPDHFK